MNLNDTRTNISWVNAEFIEQRIDAQFYKNEFVENEAMLKKLNYELLGNIYLKGDYGTLPDSNDYCETGIYLIRGTDLRDLTVSEEQLIVVPESYYNEKSQAVCGDILMLIKGATIDAEWSVSIVPSINYTALFNGSIFRMRLKQQFDPYYVTAFMSSPYFLLQKKRAISNTGIFYNDKESIVNFIVPIPVPSIQKYIGDKLRKAEEYREMAKKLREEADEIMYEEILQYIAFEDTTMNARWIGYEEVLSGRLEAEYYKSEYIFAERTIRKQKFYPLGKIVEEVQDGPGGWAISTSDYVEFGIPIIRGVNIGDDGEFLNKGFVYISEKKNNELKKTQVTPGQVLLTVRGTIGRSTVVPEYLKVGNLNAAVVRIKVKEAIVDSYYLAGFFNSKIGRLQTSRIANGAVQQNMNLTECKSNLIPIPDMVLQKRYRDAYIKYLKCKEESASIIEDVKQDIGDLVEGKFDMTKL